MINQRTDKVAELKTLRKKLKNPLDQQYSGYADELHQDFKAHEELQKLSKNLGAS